MPTVVADDRDAGRVDLEVGDVGLAEARERLPAAVQEPVVDAFGRNALERVTGFAEHEQRVAGPRLASRDDLSSRDAAVPGQEGHECLVLDRLAARDAESRTVALVQDLAPELGSELRVVRVASVHLDEQRPALGVATVEHEHAGGLALRGGEAVGLDAELPQAGRHERDLRPAGRGAEREPDRRRGRQGDQEARERTGRGCRFGNQHAEDAQPDGPAADPLQRPDELGVDGEHDCRRLGDEDGGEARARASRS